MLDQNTDRMWFVIGAVIVGAAIIFIANGTMPELFASVAESFQESSDDAGEVVLDILPYGHLLNPNTSTPNSWLYHNAGHNTGVGTEGHENGGTINPIPSPMDPIRNGLTSGYLHSTSAVIEVDDGWEIHFKKDTVEETKDQYWRVTFMDENYRYHSRWVSTTNDWTLALAEGVAYFRVSYPTASNPEITVVGNQEGK